MGNKAKILIKNIRKYALSWYIKANRYRYKIMKQN